MQSDSINILDCCKKPEQNSVICKVASDWTAEDYIGAIKCRTINSFRMKYRVEPGLYAVGTPDGKSDVFVSANYKLSFDILRRGLKGLNIWVLVLDTKGVNVWCAAGKGTFGTEELVKRINAVNLGDVIEHGRIIVPQLGATGVSADKVFKQTGFRVYFGPVYAKDIKAYLQAGRRKTAEMRKVKFSVSERLILTPMEVIPAMKKYIIFAVIVFLFFGLQASGIIFESSWSFGMPFLLLGLTSIIGGSFLTPLLLPFVPFRSFAAKGWIIGFLITVPALYWLSLLNFPGQKNTLYYAVEILFFPMASSYFALQFTGSTTFTNMSGVTKELKIAFPVYLAITAISFILLIIFKIYMTGVI